MFGPPGGLAGSTGRTPDSSVRFFEGPCRIESAPALLKRFIEPKRTISATRGKRLNQLVVRPRDSQIRSDLLEVLDDLGIERDARLPMLVHERETLLPVHIDPLLSIGLRAVLVLSREAVHVPSEFVERAERRRVEGQIGRAHV